jgi:hypothetical protein
VRANDDWGTAVRPGVSFNSPISDDEDAARVLRAELPNRKITLLTQLEDRWECGTLPEIMALLSSCRHALKP